MILTFLCVIGTIIYLKCPFKSTHLKKLASLKSVISSDRGFDVTYTHMHIHHTHMFLTYVHVYANICSNMYIYVCVYIYDTHSNN